MNKTFKQELPEETPMCKRGDIARLTIDFIPDSDLYADSFLKELEAFCFRSGIGRRAHYVETIETRRNKM